jgi:SAM-dependent methyltransferase
MDKETIDIYNQDAESIAQLHSTLIPHRVYELIQQYFIKNTATVDIGCGIGRDTHWLNNQGFLTIGVDASAGMLKQARQLYPDRLFNEDCLPELASLNGLHFQNILCSAVLMHLDKASIEQACERLLQLLRPEGCLIITLRGTNQENKRENGKLYEAIHIENFLKIFQDKQCKILVQESETEALRNLTWHNFVIKK